MTQECATPDFFKRLTALALTGAMLSGCAGRPAESSYQIARPQQPPVQTVTDFTEGLRCMDDMFLRRGYTFGVTVSSVGIPDRTQKVNAGTRDMLIAAFTTMSARSNAFRYIDNDQALQGELFSTSALGSPGIPGLQLFVRGSISQLDQSVTEDTSSLGASIEAAAGLGLNAQQLVSLMTVDMSLGDARTHAILPGTDVRNSVAVALRSKGGDFDARIGSAGLSYGYNMTDSEGTHAALRTLIELSVIEMAGRFTKMPYWQCLGLASADPRAKNIAYGQYASMRDAERVAAVAEQLRAAGYYRGAKIAVPTSELRAAAARYEQDNNLTPTGLVTFELYYALSGAPGAAVAPPLRDSSGPVVAAQTEAAHAPVVSLSRSSFENGKVYILEPVSFTADLAAAGYMVCFYQDGDGKVFRTYPSPMQPNEFIPAGRKIVMPAAGDVFRIRPSTPNAKEQYACFASAQSLLAALPANVAQPALAPLPVTGIAQIQQALQGTLGSDLKSATNEYYVYAKR